jgi:hypothetical protein
MNPMAWYRKLAPLAVFSLAVGATGCVVEPDESLESADTTSEAISASWKCDITTLGTDRCQAAMADIRAQAAAVGRSDILERGIHWLDVGINYDRSRTFEGFRRDCSGFVSMSWEISQNPSTAFFPPFVAGTYAVELGSYEDLAPGDAVNKTFRNPYGHVMLFAGWASADHSQLYFLHHYATGKPVALIQVSRSELGDFIPIRSVKVPAPVPTEPPAPVEPPPDGCGALLPGQALGIDQAAFSCDGRFALVQQSDGNLVHYRVGGEALWSTGKVGSGGQVTVMQDDGNLVTYTGDGQPVWYTGTHNNPGAWLAIHDDGNLVIYGEKALWSSGTGGH